MRVLMFLFGIFVLLSPVSGRAQENTVLIELYTSQGCSSCPAADALLPKLAEMPGVIALALHVDYWDYLGWKDSFGNVQYSTRQKAYARALHHQPLFTPQAVIQGQEILVGYKKGKILGAVDAFRSEPSPVSLKIARRAGGLTIELAGRGAVVDGPLDIQLVRFLKAAEVEIDAGENAGRVMTYTNIVTDWQTIAHWDGVEPLTLDIEADAAEPVAVIVQRAGTGPVVTAAELR